MRRIADQGSRRPQNNIAQDQLAVVGRQEGTASNTVHRRERPARRAGSRLSVVRMASAMSTASMWVLRRHTILPIPPWAIRSGCVLLVHG
jgi:hypothetical protein